MHSSIWDVLLETSWQFMEERTEYYEQLTSGSTTIENVSTLTEKLMHF